MVSQKTDRELLELVDRLSRAERAKDTHVLRKLIGDDYIGVGSSGEVLTKKAVLERFSDPTLEFEGHELSDVQVRLLGSVGWVVGEVSLRGRWAGQGFEGQFRFLDVCVKRCGRWQVAASQLTPLF